MVDFFGLYTDEESGNVVAGHNGGVAGSFGAVFVEVEVEVVVEDNVVVDVVLYDFFLASVGGLVIQIVVPLYCVINKLLVLFAFFKAGLDYTKNISGLLYKTLSCRQFHASVLVHTNLNLYKYKFSSM